jgi:hypothetical protein
MKLTAAEVSAENRRFSDMQHMLMVAVKKELLKDIS